MTVFPRFTSPWLLLLLVLVPAAIWMGSRIRSLSGPRKWTAITLRAIILASLVGALAGAQLVRINERLAVFFLVDRSNSIPEHAREATLQAIRSTCEQYMTSKDEAGVIVFGDEASIELNVDPALQLGPIQSFVDGEQTDIASAVRLAMAAFPQGYMKRIVLFSDGNETQGSALEEVKLAQAAGVAVDVVPIEIQGGNEVRLRELIAPARADTDEPFRLKIVAESDQDAQATLRVYQRVGAGRQLLQSAEVNLQAGTNAFLVPQEIQGSGFYEYEATIESASDTIMANNEGRAFSLVHGEPAVLYIDASGSDKPYLEDALKAEGINVVRIGLGSVPGSLAQFQNYDAVILDNVSAIDVSASQLKILEAMVRDLGVGLVMIGGPDSFGAGGYYDTAIERALPVNMDIKQRKIMPRGALVLILHTCEIPDGNAWSREIGMAALEVLSSQDLMGALGYDYQQGDSWIFELQPVGDKHLMRIGLNTGDIGDMPDVTPTLRMAFKALENADAAVKRVVMISDGDPAAPPASLLRSIADAKIAVSTVCIAPHRPSDQYMLANIAKVTGGKFYMVTNPNALPQIFMKEAAVVKRGLLFEKPFTPQPNHVSELLRGLSTDAIPQLKGYVVTTPKETATIPLVSSEGDPVLAHWRYGLGKSVAFTSDATSRWAGNWLGWDGYGRFWAQAVRWATRDLAASGFQVETKVQDGMGHIKIDAVDDQGRFVNFMRPHGIVSGPPPGFERREISLLQTGPGIYEGRFPVSNKGVYMINITYTRPDGSQGMLPTGLALNYSREYQYNATNHAKLERIVDVSRGRLLDYGESPFQHDLEATPTITPVWQFLALLAACLLPIEVFIRRVMFDLSAVWAAVAAVLRKLPGLTRLIPKPKAKPAAVTGSFAGMSRPARTMVYSAAATELPAAEGGGEPGMEVPSGEGEAEAAEAPDVEVEAPGHSEYTRQLLAAKQRALNKRKR